MAHEPLARWAGLICFALAALLLPVSVEAQGSRAQRDGALRDRAPGNRLPVRAIELQGLNRLSEGEILSQIRIKVGDPYQPKELDEVYQHLWRSGQFLSIQEPEVFFENAGVRIVIGFVERENVIEVRLEGVEKVRRTELREKLLTRKRGLLNPRDIKRDEQAIVRTYREKGYYFVQVQHEWNYQSGDAPQGIIVRFIVDEGPRVRVGAVRFKGNNSFPDSQLLKFMTTRPRSAFLGIPNAGAFNRDGYQQDIQNLQTFYVFKGYFDAVVAAEDFSFNLDRDRLFLGIRIDEGERYRISDVSFEVSGNGVFPESVLRQEIKVAQGVLYDEERILGDLNRLLRLYRRHSYIECAVDKKLIHSLSGNEVALIYEITEGAQAYIEEIEIRGNEETKDKVVRRELTFYPGEKVHDDKIRESYSNLARLQYFEDIDITYEQGSTPSQKKVVVDVEEGSTGSINFGFGLTSGRGLVGIVSASKRNFDFKDLPEGFRDFTSAWTGAGQTLLIQAQPGSRDSRYRVEFREPYLFDSRTSLSLRGYRTSVNRDDYDEKRVVGEIALGHRFPWDRNLRAEVAYRYELIDIGDIDLDAAPDVFRVEGDNRLSALRASLRYDRRRFTLRGLITGGWSAEVGYEYAGGFLGADVDISKANASFNVYRTLYSDEDKKHHILSIRNAFFWSDFHHNTREVPIFERYFLGGARTLRGFRFREVGPHFNRDPIGGSAMHFGTVEYTFPLIEEILRGITFVDYGNLETTFETFSANRYRLSVGAGVLINVNLFGQRLPISLTWGEALWSEDEDRERVFIFDIGTGF